MNIALFVNDRGEVCVTHDAPLPAAAEALVVDPATGEMVLLLQRRRRLALEATLDPLLRDAVCAAQTLLLVETAAGSVRDARDLPLRLKG